MDAGQVGQAKPDCQCEDQEMEGSKDDSSNLAILEKIIHLDQMSAHSNVGFESDSADPSYVYNNPAKR